MYGVINRGFNDRISRNIFRETLLEGRYNETKQETDNGSVSAAVL